MSLLDKEPVKRAEKFLKDFDKSLEVIILENSARTAKDAEGRKGKRLVLVLIADLHRLVRLRDFDGCTAGGDRDRRVPDPH